jgi:hypothetical protein
VNWSAVLVVLVPPEVVTVRFTVPEPAGEVAVSEVIELSVTFVAAVPPKLTVAPVTKFVPVTVTVVPPAAGPEVGLRELTVGVEVLADDASMRAPTAADVMAGDWVDVGATALETLGSNRTMLPSAVWS